MSHFRGNTGTLIVIVSRAKDLPNKRKMEKQNPYCLLRISNFTDKTKADIRGGQTPKWDEEFRFNITPEVQPILKLSVLDETKKAPVLISEAEVDFTPVFYASVQEGFDNWYQLTANKREAGEIYLEMTFYPSTLNQTVSLRKSQSGLSQSTKKRTLPPIPGQQTEVAGIQIDPNAIPPPLPRNQPQTASSHEFGDNGEFYHSDSFKPSAIRQEDFNRSFMSVHSLPDVPVLNNIKKELPPLTPTINEERDTPITIPDPDIIDEKKLSVESKGYDLGGFKKRFTPSFGLPLFGFNKENTEEKPKPSNAFDELERAVQSDWEKNNKSEKRQRPPPVPSHGSFSSSGGSSIQQHIIPPPLPQHSSSQVNLSTNAQEDTIEKELSSQHDRRSPTRKAPSSFYRSGTSPTRINLTESIPYNAGSIESPSLRPPPIENLHEIQSSKADDDILLERHNAPTPYDLFVNNANPSPKNSFGRTSPSRFKTSLPPPPPPH